MNQEIILPVQQVMPNRWNRKKFDDQGLKDLTDSIKAKGILENLIIRKVEEGKYEIASGERRWRAAQLAGLNEVPCRVLELSDDDVQDMNLVTNIQREDIPALEKAAMVKMLMKPGMTQDQIAQRLGKSRPWVNQLLSLLELPKAVQDQLGNQLLNFTQMRAIASLPNDSYQEQLAREIKDGVVPPEKVEHRAHQLHNGFKASMAKRNKKVTAVVASAPAVTSAPVIPPSNSAEPAMGSARKTQSAPVAAEPIATASILTALKDDVADAYLPSFGKAGVVLRQGLDKAWAAPKKGLVKWGLMFVVVSWLWHPVLKTINYAFTRLMHMEVNQAINKTTVAPAAPVMAVAEPQKFTEAMLSTVPTPTGLKPELLSGKKVHFTWNAVPGSVGYNFYSAHTWAPTYTKENTMLLTDNDVLWRSSDGPDDFRFVVTALDAQDHESIYSKPVEVDLR